MNELGNTPADKDYKPSGIVNNLAEGQIKAVQLTDGTYITEKLAKSMTKAQERAFEAYPRDIQLYVESRDTPGKWLPVDRNLESRMGFENGYEAAEKDLALTWEDIKTINQILWDLHYEGWPCESESQDEARFREALKRFKEEQQ